MVQESDSLILEVLKQADMLKMSIFEQKESISTMRHYSQCYVSWEEVNRLSQEIVLILNNTGIRINSQQDSLKELIKCAKLLWENLLTKPVKEKLRSTQIQNLSISIDEELINIPWELLYDGRNFLCLNFNLGRLIRTKEDIAPVQYRSLGGVLKMLILANPTNDLDSAYNEGLNIRNQLDRRRPNVHVDFKSTSIDKVYVKKNICDYDIVHFAGHCEYDPDDPKSSGWVLADGKFTSRDIILVGSSVSSPSLIFSNACYSARMQDENKGHNYSLTQAFLFSGVRHYVGAIRRLEDPVSFIFSKEFYTQLICGVPIGESLRLSRLKLLKEYGIMSLSWASYLLYGNPNFILFRPYVKSEDSEGEALSVFANKRRHVIIAVGLILLLFLAWLGLRRHNLLGNLKYDLANTHINLNNRFQRLRLDVSLRNYYAKMGSHCLAIKNYQCTIDYYMKNLKIDQANEHNSGLVEDYNMLARAYIGLKNWQEAEIFLNKAILISEKLGIKLDIASNYYNLGLLYKNIGKKNMARQALRKAQEIYSVIDKDKYKELKKELVSL